MANEPRDTKPGFRCLGEGHHVVSFGLSEIVKEPNPSISVGLVHRKSAREIRRAAERAHRREAKKALRKGFSDM